MVKNICNLYSNMACFNWFCALYIIKVIAKGKLPPQSVADPLSCLAESVRVGHKTTGPNTFIRTAKVVGSQLPMIIPRGMISRDLSYSCV